MNIKQDPGCAPGFERSVNAEPGPMGAGAGAAAAIDNNEPSPRGAAIEKAQAELRRDLAVREERRRELEFLEKGGEPLDFKFGEAPLVNFSPLSPKEPLVDRLLPLKSEEEAVCTADVVINGDLCNGSKGCAGAVEGLDDMSVVLVPANEQSCSRLSSLDLGVGDPAWALNESASKTDIDSCQGVHGRAKSAAHVNRNRVRSQRLGNGHALSKELESVVGGDRQVVEPESTATPGAVENEDMVDMSYQVLPHQSQHGLPSKWNGLTTSQEYEPVNEIMARCGPVLEQHPSDHSSRDRASAPSLKSLQTSDVRAGSRVVVAGRDSDRSSLAGECSPYQAADRPDTHEQAVAVGERRDARAGGRQVEGISNKDVVGANTSRISEGDAGAADQGTEKGDGVSPVVRSTGVGVARLPDSAAGSRDLSDSVQESHGTEARAAQGTPESRTQILADGSRGASTHRDLRVVKKAAASSRGGSHSRLARPGVDEKKVNVHHVRLKTEDGVAEDRAKHLATQAEPGGHGINGAHSQELRTGAQAGATVGGAPRSIGRPSSNSGTPNCKYPGVVLPWEKGQDSAVQAEAERHNAELREKLANKAREEFILEEAEHLKVKRKLLEERKTMKPFAEPGRRKSHWDYVLEEMKWMANDFWQERMWKRYQAAHVCLEIAMRKGEDEFLAADLTREQHRVSRILASAVKDFWHTAEVAMTKEKSDSRSSGQEQIVRRTSESEVDPMDVDFPVTKEGSEKSVRHEKAGKEQLVGVQKYAIQLLKESGFQRIRQAEPPSTPERHRESNSILDQAHQVPLFYEVPTGSMEAYRAAVEAEHARSEEEHEKRRAAATAEAEALAAAEADDASAGADVSYADFSNDGGSQEDEPAIFTTEGSRISRKKRKKIFKTSSIGSRAEGSTLQGLPYRPSALLSSEAGIPSPLVTGKRSFTGGSGPNTLPGSIPVKRARSSAANLRPRGTQPGASPGGYMAQRGSGPQFQQDDGLDVLDGSSQGDVNSDTPGSKGVAGDGRLKKKKKTRPYPGLSFSDGGTAADTPAKNSDGIAQDLRHEQMKRKADTHWVSIGGSDTGLDTPGTPGSQGLSGQQSSKKQKSLRQAETNSEAVQAGQQAASALGANKLLRQNSMRDRNRRVRPSTKVPPSTPTGGVGIPWSAGEDQAILALVHDLGPNWELVSDVLSSNSQIKGICRKPVQCKERHKALTERGSEGLENTEDPSSSQPQASKGNMRGPRGQSAAEEDTLKHFEQIIMIVQKYGARKIPSESEDQKVLQASHPSHGIAISQFCTGSGGPSNPVDLADRVTGSDDLAAHPHPAQPPQGNVLGPPIVGPMPGLGMRPPAGGLPLVLPGTNGLHLGQGSVSPAAMSAAAARDAQRFNMSFSNEEAARLQMATSKLTEFNARRAQQQAGSATSGVPVLGGLPNSNGLPMLSTSTSGGMLVGLNRGLSLPRAGLAGMGSPVVSSMGTAGLSGRLPPSGNLAASNVSRRVAGLVNVARNAGCTEEQRLQAFQQLQAMAQQGDGQAGAALASLTGGGDMGNSVDGLNQPFSLHHQHSLQQQQQQQHPQEQHQQLHQQQLHHMNNSSSKLQAQVQQHSHQMVFLYYQQMQLPGAPQAYVAVPTRMKEQQQQQQLLQQRHQQQQHQQQLQQQQKQRLLGNLPPNPQAQHMLVAPHPAAAAGLPAQHLKSQAQILPPQQHNSLQKQLMQQVGSPSQGAQLSAASSSLQSTPASPGKSGQQSTPSQQNERAGQMPQGSLSGKPPQPNQNQNRLEQTAQMLLQQQASRNSKGVSRGAMLMQGPPAQTTQASALPGGANGQLQVEAPGQMQAGQRGLPQAQAQPGKAPSGSQAGNPGGSQSQGGQLHGPQSQTLSSVVAQQKGPQQQTAQGGAGKQQQGATSQPPGQSGAQQAGPASTSSQQPAMAASSGAPNQQPQQLHRRQVGQPQPPRRLQTKHPSATMGTPIPGPLGKTGAQPTGQGAPSQMPQPGQNPYQFGGTVPIGMSNPNLHGIPLSSALNSSTAEAQPAQWKPNQTLPPLPGGIYNLTRTSSPGSGQGPGMVTGGVHSNGNIGTSSLSSPGVQGVGLGNMAQGLGGVQGTPGLLTQKLGVGPGMSGRGLSGPLGVVAGQRNQPTSAVPPPLGLGNMPSYQARPPAPSSVAASPTSSTGVAVLQGGGRGGPYQGVSVPMSGPTATAGQLRQPHGEHASSTPSLPSSQRAAIPAGSGSTSSDSTIPPSAPDQGPPPSVEPTAASSS